MDTLIIYTSDMNFQTILMLKVIPWRHSYLKYALNNVCFSNRDDSESLYFWAEVVPPY